MNSIACKNKNILITGSEGLIGKVLVKYLSNVKNNLILKLDLSLGDDLTDENYVKEYFKNNSQIDYLVNLFAINDHVGREKKVSVLNTDGAEIKKYCDINIIALFNVCKYFYKYSKRPKGIINFSSLYGVRAPKKFIYDNNEKHIGYTISKHAVMGLSKHLSTHLENTIKYNWNANK